MTCSTEQGLRAGILELILDGEQFAETVEEGFDAGHHHGAGDGRDVALQRAPAQRLDEGQHTHRHDRILQDQAGQFAGIDAVEVGRISSSRRLVTRRTGSPLLLNNKVQESMSGRA
jgi:hypothetical protein